MSKKYSGSTWAKFLLMSAIGIFVFFINVPFNGKANVPMLHIINTIKAAVPARGNEMLVMILCVSTVFTALWAWSKNAPAWIKAHHPKDGLFSWSTYVTSAIFGIMVVFNVGPIFIIDELSQCRP